MNKIQMTKLKSSAKILYGLTIYILLFSKDEINTLL